MERFQLLTKERWPDFEKMFEKHKGVRGGCWCSFYLSSSGEYAKLDREGRKLFHLEKLNEHPFTGGLYFVDDVPVAWCQFGPYLLLTRLLKNRLIGELATNSENVWRISCIFVDKDHRKLGYGRKAVEQAIEQMIIKGATVIEAFPFEFADRDSGFQHNGSVEFYAGLGFKRIGRVGRNEVLMRLMVIGNNI